MARCVPLLARLLPTMQVLKPGILATYRLRVVRAVAIASTGYEAILQDPLFPFIGE